MQQAETFTLPSGGDISINQPDFDQCKTSEDFMEIKYALNEKIIGIEFQIDMHAAGLRDTTDPSWLPRANASLKWAKLYRDEAQNRQGRRTSLEKQMAHSSADRCVIEILKEILSPNDFEALLSAAKKLENHRLGFLRSAKIPVEVGSAEPRRS